MKIQRRRDRKLNNAGMSLVEIVVAMFILAAVTAVILSVFVYSIRLNSRSRTRQQTTAAAQTVMENFKAYSVQEIGEQFVAGNFAGNSAVTLQMEDPANPGTPLSAPVPGGNTNFQILGMQYQNERYDVKIELTGHDLDSPHGRMADMQTFIYENRTAENSAAYVGDLYMDADALSQIADVVAGLWTDAENDEEAATPAPGPTSEPSGDPDPSETPAPAADHSGSEVDLSQIVITQRVITFTIKKDAADCVVEVGCKYYYGGNDYQYGVTETGTPKKFHIDSDIYEIELDGDITKEIFRQPMDGDKVPLENLVIYYYPAYKNHTSVKVQADKIEVDVESSIPNEHEIKCYIYKQKNMYISDIQVSKAELASYRLELDLDTNVKVYDDNLDTILGSPTSIYTYDVAGTMTNRYHGIGYAAEKMGYPSPGTTPSPAMPTVTMPTAMPTKTVENLRIMYDIKISVYREGDLLNAGTPLSELEGTIIE